MNTLPSTIALFTESGTSVKTFELLLDPSISYSDLKNTVELSADVNLIKILVKDEEGDLITVTTESELQEAYRFSSQQNSLFIKAICKPNLKQQSKIQKPIVVTAPAPVPTPAPAPAPKELVVTVTPTPIEVVTSIPTVLPQNNQKPTQSKMRHLAYCNSCKKDIYGIRYKCTTCLDYDLCEICEDKNLTEKIHSQNHYFLKINKPVSHAQLRACIRNMPLHLKGSQQESVTNVIPPLEERVVAAESRLQTLEVKMRELALLPKNRKALKKMILEEQGKVKAQSCDRRKKMINVKTTPPPPPVEEPQEEKEVIVEKKEEEVVEEIKKEEENLEKEVEDVFATTSCQPIEGSFFELSLVRAAADLPDPLPISVDVDPLTKVLPEPEPEPEPEFIFIPDYVPEEIEKEQEKQVEADSDEEEDIEELEPEAVGKLVAMGFDRDFVKAVVAVYRDVDEALEHLLEYGL